MKSFLTTSRCVVAAMFAVVLFLGGVVRSETSTYDAYTAADGQSYIVVGLQGTPLDRKLPQEVVFLVDTSASQTGQFRADAFAVLKETLQRLPQGTRIGVMAVDVQAVKLTTGLVAKDGPEAATALTALQRRVPLGATNLTAGITAASAAFSEGKPAQRTVVYIGDGRNMATTLERSDFTSAVAKLNDLKAPLTVCAIGPQVQYDVLGSLVTSTGGALIDFATIVSDAELAARDRLAATGLPQQSLAIASAGTALAAATDATVIWCDPKANPFPSGWEVYPKTLPPLRSDRETLIVARTSKPLAPVALTVSGNTPAANLKMEWEVAPGNDSYSNHPYLRDLFEMAASTEGELFPLVGRPMLDAFRDQFTATEEQKGDAALFAQQAGSKESAKLLARSVLETSPGDKIAQQIVSGETSSTAAPSDARAPELVDAVIQARDIRTEKLSAEVSVALQQADKAMTKHPEETIQNLRLTMEMVRHNASLNSQEREQLLDKLGNKLKYAQREKERTEQRRLEEAARQARRDDRLRALSELEGKSEKLTQMFNRYNHLMSAREYDVAEEASLLALKIVPNDPTATSAATLAAATKYIDESITLRYKRERGFVEGLQSVERSFVPIMDDPPIVYPEADVWRRLSEHRKERWESNDLTVTDPVEKEIRKMMDRTITEFVLPAGTRVEDLINEIKRQNPRWKDIDINVVDVTPSMLTMTGVGQEAEDFKMDTDLLPDGKTYRNMKLSSILKQVLSKADAGYFIKDQALHFAHADIVKLALNRPVRVYNIMDLSQQMGGGMGGGMMGGMGGMMGGMGGMMGGMGGGYGNNSGGNNFGGNNNNNNRGGNQWSVPDEAASTADLTAASPIPLPSLTASDPESVWETYFTQVETSPETTWFASRRAIQDTVRSLLKAASVGLTNNQKDAAKIAAGRLANRHVIAVIESALRHRQMQPWMYEALAISLYVADAPREEIARAVFSAADVCTDPLELVLIAQFAEGLGDSETAIPLYKQVVRSMPGLRPPLVRLLRLAVEHRDNALTEWATLAIAHQEWDGPQGERLMDESKDAAAALVAALREAGKTAEAERYITALAEASRRDCVMEIEWTGDALLSVAVQEPNGSVCGQIKPRSLGGGVLQESLSASQSKVAYTCPIGFAGDYKLSILKDYGRVTDDSVKVSLTTLENGEAKKQTRFFKLGPNGALIDVNIPTGRRTEPLDEAIVATAAASLAATQAATVEGAAISNFLGRASDVGIHAQIGDVPVPNPTTGVYESTGAREAVAPLAYYGGGYRRPFWGAGAVGYRPEITLLDDGIRMPIYSAAATADRRYVIIPNMGMNIDTIVGVEKYTYIDNP